MSHCIPDFLRPQPLIIFLRGDQGFDVRVGLCLLRWTMSNGRHSCLPLVSPPIHRNAFFFFFSCSSWATRPRLRCVPSHSETGQRLAFSSFLTQTILTSNHQTSGAHTWPKLPKRRLSPRRLFNHRTQPQSSKLPEMTTPAPPLPGGEQSAPSQEQSPNQVHVLEALFGTLEVILGQGRPEQRGKAC